MNAKLRMEISILAKKYEIDRVILFGSRARGDNHERSDIDLAVSGKDFGIFALDANESLNTLLKIDFVNLDAIDQNLRDEIDRDGVVLYEKA